MPGSKDRSSGPERLTLPRPSPGPGASGTFGLVCGSGSCSTGQAQRPSQHSWGNMIWKPKNRSSLRHSLAVSQARIVWT